MTNTAYAKELEETIQFFLHTHFPNEEDSIYSPSNTYWLARLLSDRFFELEVYYLPDKDMFCAGDGIHFFYNGKVYVKEFFPEFLRFDLREAAISPEKYLELLKKYRD